MKAIAISALGGVDVLQAINVPIPSPAANEVLIQIHAVSINPVETKIRNGSWAGGNVAPGTKGGFDFAGRISFLGSAVPPSAFSEGDEIYGLGSTVPTHSNAEYVTVDWRVLARKPVRASWEDAAALPLFGLTAWEMLVEQLEVKRDKGALLVVNGAGGVGSVSLQIARKYLGLRTIIATASRPETFDCVNHVMSLGATHIVSHRPPLGPQIKALKLDEPVKYIAVFSTATRDIIDQVIDVVAPGGKIGLAVQGLPEAYGGIGKGQLKSVSLHWGFVFSKMILNYDLAFQGQILTELAKLYDAGELKSIVTWRSDLTVKGLRKAHTVMEEGNIFGKMDLGVPATGASD